MLSSQKNSDHIILVEDDADFATLLYDFLSPQGYKITQFESPLLALQELKGFSKSNGTNDIRPLPVILSDNQMPDMDGLSFLKIVKEERPELPFILMTAFGSNQTEDLANKGGAFGFIRKPFGLLEIGKLMHQAFNKIKTLG